MAETLNLVNPKDSLSFEYEISRFPDGQQSLKLVEDGYNTFHSLKNNRSGITIYSRLNTFSDLEIIICATQALKEVGVKNIRLYIPYCIGGRSDRKFAEGGFNYIKNVISPIINLQKYEEVSIMDPHSDVLEACINNFYKIDNTKLMNFVIKDYFLMKNKTKVDFSNVLFVSPDAGALKKVYSLAEVFGYKNRVIIGSKRRDTQTGKIIGSSVDLSPNDADKDLFIIDDLCDGGRTFIELAKAIDDVRKLSSSVQPQHYGKNYLIVTHGIFSGGFDLLAEHFDGIYCTNSVKDITDGTIVNTFSKHKTIYSLLKQLNIF